MTIDLVCFGNLTIDDIVLPDGTTRLACFGGDAIYAALGASYWGNQVRFVAPIGTDFPAEHLSLLQRSGWDLSGLPRRNVPSIRNWVFYHADGSRRWELESNPDDFFELSPIPEDIPPHFREARAAMLLAMDLAAQERLVTHLKRSGVMVGLDPQEDYIDGNVRRICAMLKNVDVFTPSEVEAVRLLGHNDYEQAARQFADYGCRVVVIKLGSEGALLYQKSTDQFWRVPVYPTQVVDTTGAGDAFCGGFMAMYTLTSDLYNAGLAGAVSASFAVEDFGLSHMFDVTPKQALNRFIELSGK